MQANAISSARACGVRLSEFVWTGDCMGSESRGPGGPPGVPLLVSSDAPRICPVETREAAWE
jgi:hypothetical protein